MKFGVLLQPVDLLKLMLNIICTSNIQGRELCWCDLMKCTISIIMCQDTCELICFKLGMILNTTKLNSLIPVWMTLMFTQGHGVTGQVEIM